jgi:hypothetical protein
MTRPGAPPTPALTVRAVDARLVQVSMRRALRTSAGHLTHAPLVLLDVHTEQGITGRAYLFCYLEAVGRAVLALARESTTALAGGRRARRGGHAGHEAPPRPARPRRRQGRCRGRPARPPRQHRPHGRLQPGPEPARRPRPVPAARRPGPGLAWPGSRNRSATTTPPAPPRPRIAPAAASSGMRVPSRGTGRPETRPGRQTALTSTVCQPVAPSGMVAVGVATWV